MLHILTHDILPVFSMLALGFLLGRIGTFGEDEARTMNRVAFLVLQPPLIFTLLYGLDLAHVRIDAIALYAACEVAGIAVAFCIARYLFRRGPLESWLLAMAVTFVNTLLYIWPISELIYGPGGAAPVAGIVGLDASITFAAFIILMELRAGDRAAGKLGQRLTRNPVLWSIALALGCNLAALPVPEPLLTAFAFAGAGTAPVTLFALGVILSGQSLVPGPAVATFSALKLIGFPLLVFGALALASPGNPWAPQVILASAGPSGAMAFALAVLYRVRTDVIAPVIIWTSVLSLISLAWLA